MRLSGGQASPPWSTKIAMNKFLTYFFISLFGIASVMDVAVAQRPYPDAQLTQWEPVVNKIFAEAVMQTCKGGGVSRGEGYFWIGASSQEFKKILEGQLRQREIPADAYDIEVIGEIVPLILTPKTKIESLLDFLVPPGLVSFFERTSCRTGLPFPQSSIGIAVSFVFAVLFVFSIIFFTVRWARSKQREQGIDNQ